MPGQEVTQDQLDSISRQRSAERGQATKDLSTVEKDLQTITSANHEHACKILRRLTSHQEKLERWDSQLLPWVEKADESRETTQAMKYQLDLDDGIATLSVRIEAFKAAEAARLAPQPASNAKASNSDASGPSTGPAPIIQHERIPEIDLPKFDGDILEWQAFWDDFTQSVDEREDIPTVTKFKLLRKCLTGSAAATCKHYKLTIENYQEVKSILEERYGDQETAAAMHHEKLVLLPPAKSYSVSELIRVRDECEAHIRALGILGFKEEQHGALFFPIVLSKLPKMVRLDIRKQKKLAGNGAWNMEKLRKMLSVEIEMRSINEYEYFAFDIDRNSSSQEDHEDDYSDSSQQHGRESRKPGKRPNSRQQICFWQKKAENRRKSNVSASSAAKGITATIAANTQM